jgi:2-phospho-L-lactate guanylyltransferase
MRSVKPAWAIVPAKSLARGKSRLGGVLDDGARAAFARGLLEHVLGVLGGCDLAGVLVATDGDDVAELARAHGAVVRRDRGEGSLAAVVDASLADVASRGAGAAVVLMGDLPRIDPRDVKGLLAALDACDVALVRDHLGHHTNALALAPPQAILTSFGSPCSFALHCESARKAGLRVEVVENDRIAFDVDGPADLARLASEPAARLAKTAR